MTQDALIEIEGGLGLITWRGIPIGIVTPAGAELFTTTEDCIEAGMSAYEMIGLGAELPAIRQELRDGGLTPIIEDGLTIDQIIAVNRSY